MKVRRSGFRRHTCGRCRYRFFRRFAAAVYGGSARLALRRAG